MFILKRMRNYCVTRDGPKTCMSLLHLTCSLGAVAIAFDHRSLLPHNERSRAHSRELRNPQLFPAQRHNMDSMEGMDSMDIKNSRRLLIVGAPDAGVLPLLKELTGSAPEPTSNTTAGLTHELRIETKYYTATVPIWIDELPNVAEWRTEFTKPEAREVVTALGAWVYCFKRPVEEKDVDKVKETMQAISDVIERACGYGGDIACLAVAMPQSVTPYLDKSHEEWEELAMDYGFEYIDSEKKGKNEFGEATGVQRVREALEAAEWESSAALDFGEDEEGFENSFEAEEAEMNMELFGMKNALAGYDGDEEGETDDKDVEDLEVMMRKVVAIKEMGEGMEEGERKRFAAKAVNDLMKDF